MGLANIDRLRLTSRIDNAEWWSDSPVCRDYARAWLKSGDDCCEAWIYIDRRNGQGYLHGWLD